MNTPKYFAYARCCTVLCCVPLHFLVLCFVFWSGSTQKSTTKAGAIHLLVEPSVTPPYSTIVLL